MKIFGALCVVWAHSAGTFHISPRDSRMLCGPAILRTVRTRWDAPPAELHSSQTLGNVSRVTPSLRPGTRRAGHLPKPPLGIRTLAGNATPPAATGIICYRV